MKIYLIYGDAGFGEPDDLLTLMADKSKADTLVKKLNNQELTPVILDLKAKRGEYTFVPAEEIKDIEKRYNRSYVEGYSKYYVKERDLWTGGI